MSMENKLFVVADGMGGHNGGDIASQMAVKVLPDYVHKNLDMDPVNLLTGSIKESNHGLHGKVSDEDILYLVNKFVPDPAVATQTAADQVIKALIDQANDNGGQDNITAILVIAQ
eukprot:gene34617-biopygen20897